MNEAALRIHSIVNDGMANASRVQAVERGYDPAVYSLVGFGGAGPVHAYGVASRLRLRTLIVPPSAGLGSAVGLLLAPRTFRLSRTFIGTLDRLDWRRVEALFAEMVEEATAALRSAGVSDAEMLFERTADMRYRGQRKELTVDLPAKNLKHDSERALRQSFEKLYANIYHRTHADHRVEALAWRLVAKGPPITKQPRAGAGTALDRDPVALGHIFLDRFGRRGDAGFVRARLGWHSDVHRCSSSTSCLTTVPPTRQRRLASATANAPL